MNEKNTARRALERCISVIETSIDYQRREGFEPNPWDLEARDMARAALSFSAADKGEGRCVSLRCFLNLHKWAEVEHWPGRYVRFECARCGLRIEGPHLGDHYPLPGNRLYRSRFRTLRKEDEDERAST